MREFNAEYFWVNDYCLTAASLGFFQRSRHGDFPRLKSQGLFKSAAVCLYTCYYCYFVEVKDRRERFVCFFAVDLYTVILVICS